MLDKLVTVEVYTSICVGERCEMTSPPLSTLCIDRKVILMFSSTVACARNHENEAGGKF